MAIEIVDLPIDSMVIFHSYVSLPEGGGYVQTWGRGLPVSALWRSSAVDV